MYKEFAICIIVIALIVIGDILTQNSTNKIIQEVAGSLLTLRQEIVKEGVSKQKAQKLMEEANKIWQKKYEVMAYYIEHDELEKVETELTKMKADIEVEEYEVAVENLDTCIFILEHIKDKSALKIVNLF